MRQKEPSNLAKLRSIRRRRVRVSGEPLVEKTTLEELGPLPLVIRPRQGMDVDLVSWAEAHGEEIESDLARHGGLLFRDFGVESVEVFDRLAGVLVPDRVNYIEGSSPRIMLTEKVYTSTEYPPEYPISQHNELSYAHRFPAKLLFYCLIEPQDGGETPIADSRRVFEEIDPEIRRRFMEKGVRYTRNMHGGRGAGLSWQTVFETEDHEFIESYCREGGLEFHWQEGDFLSTSQNRPAVITHPRTGDQLWFNQVDQWHPSNLGDEVAKALLETTSEDVQPINAYFGDGTPLDPADLDEIRHATARVTVKFPWRQGDVLLLDNMLVSHGRSPFSGSRKVLVTMGEPVSLSEVEHIPTLPQFTAPPREA